MTADRAVIMWMGVVVKRWPKEAVASSVMPAVALVNLSLDQNTLEFSPGSSMPVFSVKPKFSQYS